MRRPFLLDGFKFDLRVYILMTSIDPLRVFIYRDGLVRLSTTPYEPPNPGNVDQVCCVCVCVCVCVLCVCVCVWCCWINPYPSSSRHFLIAHKYMCMRSSSLQFPLSIPFPANILPTTHATPPMQQFMHLTNYAINKQNEDFVLSDSRDSVRAVCMCVFMCACERCVCVCVRCLPG